MTMWMDTMNGHCAEWRKRGKMEETAREGT